MGYTMADPHDISPDLIASLPINTVDELVQKDFDRQFNLIGKGARIPMLDVPLRLLKVPTP